MPIRQQNQRMRTHSGGRWAVAFGLLLALSACAGQRRIVAFGDVHGDLEATKSALRLAGAIDDQDRWVGGKLVVVQTGDQLDRGDDERAILDLFEKLRVEAERAGGAFHALLGNHELMNARGDLRYVTEGGFADFADVPVDTVADPRLTEFDESARGRMAAFLPGGPYARRFAERQIIHREGNTLFAHGGVLPAHVAYGIDRINDDAARWLRGEAEATDVMIGSESPQWTRLYSRDPDSTACAVLDDVLSRTGADRIVVGHTPHLEGITSVCEGRAWLVDVGMAAYYGGSVAVLEIVDDSVRVLSVGPTR